jgi:hypothetical protein
VRDIQVRERSQYGRCAGASQPLRTADVQVRVPQRDVQVREREVQAVVDPQVRMAAVAGREPPCVRRLAATCRCASVKWRRHRRRRLQPPVAVRRRRPRLRPGQRDAGQQQHGRPCSSSDTRPGRRAPGAQSGQLGHACQGR